MNAPGSETVAVSAALKAIVPGYLQNRRDDIARLRGMLAKGDFERLASVGHQIAGSGAGYGFPAITRIGRELEAAAGDADAEAVETVVQTLADYVERVTVVFTEPGQPPEPGG